MFSGVPPPVLFVVCGAPEPEVAPEDADRAAQKMDEAERVIQDDDDSTFRVSRRSAGDAAPQASHRRAARRRQNVQDDDE